MKLNKTLWYAGLVGVLAVLIAPLALAQSDPFEINGDVDNDGVVGPTDIQHVINDALGLNDHGTDAVNLERRPYIVASPRASLALRPAAIGNPDAECAVIGAATNFARRNGRLLVRKGTAIVFRYDRNGEGVWHKDACGLLRTDLIVEIHPVPADAPVPPDGEEGSNDGWVLVGRDGASGRRCGPSIATAGDVFVPKLFENAGDFLVRCTIITVAIPEKEIVPEGETTHFCGAARAANRVFTRIRVVDRDANGEDVNWEASSDAPTVGLQYGDRLQEGVDDGIALP